jgi:hypothetical protein
VVRPAPRAEAWNFIVDHAEVPYPSGWPLGCPCPFLPSGPGAPLGFAPVGQRRPPERRPPPPTAPNGEDDADDDRVLIPRPRTREAVERDNILCTVNGIVNILDRITTNGRAGGDQR